MFRVQVIFFSIMNLDLDPKLVYGEGGPEVDGL